MRFKLFSFLCLLSLSLFGQNTSTLDSLLIEVKKIALPINDVHKFEKLNVVLKTIQELKGIDPPKISEDYALFEDYMASGELWAKENLDDEDFANYQIDRFVVNDVVRNSAGIIRLGHEILGRDEEIYDRNKAYVIYLLRIVYVELEAYTELLQLHPYIEEYSMTPKYPENKPYLFGGLNNDLAIIHYNMKNYSRAIEEFTRIAETKGDERGTLWSASNYNNIGLCYFHLNNFEKARDVYNLALEEVKRGPFHEESSQNLASVIEGNLAEIDLKEGKYDKALNVFLKEISVTRNYDGGVNATSAYMNAGEAYLRKGNKEMALAYLDSSVRSFNTYTSVHNRIDGLNLRADAHLFNGNINAYQTDINAKNRIVDSVELLRANRQNTIAIAKFQNEEKDRELERSKKTIAQKEKKTFWIASGLIMLFISFLFFYNRSKNKAQKIKLVKQVDEQTKEILHQKEQLEELDDFKSRFYTNITHEFRTPLTVILGMANQLDTNLNSLSGAKVKEKLTLIKRNGNSLLNLINQMLSLSKIENNELTTHFIQGDVVAHIRYIAESYHSHANSRNVMLKVESSETKIMMDYDPEKFRQILSNLISNAIKYTKTGEKITIYLSRENSVNDHLILKIEDTGTGISTENIPHIFDRFYQVEDHTSKAGGSGIGLSLTKELVLLLDGTIEVESTLGIGSEFTVRLPISNNATLKQFVKEDSYESLDTEDSTPQLTDSDNIKTPGTKLPSLLIVEDNLDVSEYLASCLRNEYHLSFAYNGQAGIDRAIEIIPEIIISDVMMPEKDGFELCETLKADEKTNHIPVILLTAKADMDSKIDGLKKGADAYLRKPFHEKELNVVLQNLLANRKKLQTKYSQLAIKFPNEIHDLPIQNVEDVFIQKLRKIIEEELSNSSLNANAVCKKMGMARATLYGKLKAITGFSFNIYLRKLRLNKAKSLLETSDLNISEIAYEVGFNDPLYFSKTFSDEFGMPPSKYIS